MLQVWNDLHTAPELPGFDNSEGGDVRQCQFPVATLRHCANYAAALSILKSAGRPMRLLEVGCGSGALSRAFARAMPAGWSMLATDYSPSLVESARRLYSSPNLSFAVMDARRLEPGQLAGFDAVLLFEVIEHLPVPAQRDLLCRIHSALPPGALLLFSTPDRTAFSRSFSGYPAHVMEYTRAALERFLAGRCGLGHAAVHRLASRRIVDESDRSERGGEYLLNRLHRLARSVWCKSPTARSALGLAQRGFVGVTAALRGRGEFDLEGYVATLGLVLERHEEHDADSFGLLAVVVKP